jgi:hypothetical protein
MHVSSPPYMLHAPPISLSHTHKHTRDHVSYMNSVIGWAVQTVLDGVLYEFFMLLELYFSNFLSVFNSCCSYV